MAKHALICLSKLYMTHGLFDKKFLEDLFKDLPDDAKLVSCEVEMLTQKGIFVIESQDFIDTAPTVARPEIIATIYKKPRANGCYVSLNLSTALDPNRASAQANGCLCASLNDNVCTFCINSTSQHLKSTPGSYTIPPTTASNFRGLLPGHPAFGFSEPSKVAASCTHSWKAYQGLNEMFNYCEHCNEKQSN